MDEDDDEMEMEPPPPIFRGSSSSSSSSSSGVELMDITEPPPRIVELGKRGQLEGAPTPTALRPRVAVPGIRGQMPAPPSLPALPPPPTTHTPAAIAAASSSSSSAAPAVSSAAAAAAATDSEDERIRMPGRQLTKRQTTYILSKETPEMTRIRENNRKDILHQPQTYWKKLGISGIKEISETVFHRRYSDLETTGGQGKFVKHHKMKRDDYFKDLMSLIQKARGGPDDAA